MDGSIILHIFWVEKRLELKNMIQKAEFQIKVNHNVFVSTSVLKIGDSKENIHYTGQFSFFVVQEGENISS